MLTISGSIQDIVRRVLLVAARTALAALLIFQFTPGPSGRAWAGEPAALDDDQGDTKFAQARPWDSQRDFPRPIAEDTSVTYDYPIVYVRVPRPYPKEYFNINHLNQAGLHQTNAPGAELRLLHPDGRDELLVPVQPQESITDPAVSLDGQWVYYAKFHHMATGATASMTKLQSRQGADLYKIHVPSRKIVQLTFQERTPNSGAIPDGVDSHPRGVHNLAPCPVAGGKLVFVSDRNGYRGVREQTQPALQLFVMDDDGSNVEHIGPLNLGTALHPVALKDGRVMFSSLETQGLRSDERWGIWAIHPDGTNWGPLTSALGSPPGQAVHFQAQLSDESIVVESYYQTGSTDGFGTYWNFPLHAPAGAAPFGNGQQLFAPRGLRQLTLFANFADVRPNHRENQVYNQPFVGNVTQPSCAPDNHMLTTWALPWAAQDQSLDVYDAGIYLLKSGRPINHPSKMLLVKNDPHYQELWPRALVPYKRIYGIDEPPRLVHRNDGQQSPHLPAGTPFGLVGTSSLYKRESYPSGIVPQDSVTAGSASPADRQRQWRELAVSRFSKPGNWGEQGSDAGLYDNSDIWGIRILVLEPVSDAVFKERRHFALGSNSEERIRILGEFPVRKLSSVDFRSAKGDSFAERKTTEPLDPDGNPDTSFLAKVPADVAWTFQTLDNNGMVLNMAQTWHQVRPGEIRNNCGGCHAHSQQPTPIELTVAARPGYKVWDLTTQTPLFAPRADDKGPKWDKEGNTSVEFTTTAVKDVEFYRDIKPLLDRSCVACHSREQTSPAGKLALDDYRPAEKDGVVPWAENVHIPKTLPRTYARLVQYSWAFQSRRSPLIWKLYGRRLDGFDNDDIASPPLDLENERNVLEWCHQGKNKERDVDFTGSPMPPAEAVAGSYKTPKGRTVKVPPLTNDERLTFARWIDIGCPIDTEYVPGERGRGWLLDEGRPTLTLASPEPGANTQPLTRILLGAHDYLTGLSPESLSVVADFEIDGIRPGENLAAKFTRLPESRWEFVLTKPIKTLQRGNLTVSIKDRQGNVTTINRKFEIDSAK
jgi:hypothetical protein